MLSILKQMLLIKTFMELRNIDILFVALKTNLDLYLVSFFK